MTAPRHSAPRRSARRRRFAAVVATAALAAAPTLAAAPSHAAPAKVTVSVSASARTATVGTTVKFTGKVTGRSAKATVALQRRSGAKWITVKKAAVKSTKKYALTTSVRAGKTTYRVKVKANAKVRAAATRPVAVTGKASAASAYTTAQKRILADTNAFRKKNGLAPLRIDAAMSKVATSWSRHLGRSGSFLHNPNYSSQIPSGWTVAGENIAGGQTSANVVDAWINSPGHRANLLGDFTHIGIGAVTVPGSGYGTYFTQNFANYPKR